VIYSFQSGSYPNSVADGYLSYQFYDSLQGLCSYLRGVVSTSAVLTAAGVGNVEATAMSAALQWALKDGLGLLGGLFFSYHASPHFDSHVKEFRLFADIINDLGLTLDMITPHLPNRRHVLVVGSCATLCRVMCGMAAGATKGSITQHFALGNMADLNAKEGTQETLVSLVGMVWGIGLARHLQGMEERDDGGGMGGVSLVTMVSWFIFVVLTVVHLWANYVGVMTLRLRTLNRERAEVVLDDFIRAGVAMVQRAADADTDGDGDTTNVELEQLSILTPNECHESLLQSTLKLLSYGNVRLGARLSDTRFIQRHSSSSLPMDDEEDNYLRSVFEDEFCNEQYALVVAATGRSTPLSSVSSSSSQQIVNVLLQIDCTEVNVLKSFLHAMIVRQTLTTRTTNASHQCRTTNRCIVSSSKGFVDDIFRYDHLSMEKLASLGWDDTLHLGYRRWRAQWGHDKDKDE